MASWTTPVIHATGDVLAVTDWNGVANNTTFLYQAPYCMYYANTQTSVPGGGGTAIAIDGTQAYGYGFSASATNGNSILVPITGIYQFIGCVTVSGLGGTATNAIVYSYFAGSVSLQGVSTSPYVGSPTSLVSGLASLAAADIGQLAMFSDASSTLTGQAAANVTYAHAFFVGSQ